MDEVKELSYMATKLISHAIVYTSYQSPNERNAYRQTFRYALLGKLRG